MRNTSIGLITSELSGVRGEKNKYVSMLGNWDKQVILVDAGRELYKTGSEAKTRLYTVCNIHDKRACVFRHHNFYS